VRDTFTNELEAINGTLAEMGELVQIAMQNATQALLTADAKLAEQTIQNDNEIDEMQHELDSRALMVMARQAPVASDLRVLVTALRMSSDFERMGDFAHHIARLTRMYVPNNVLPAELHATVGQMGLIATRLVDKLIKVIETRDEDLALQIEVDDDEMDKVQKELMSSMMSDSWTYGVEVAVNMTLLTRYYERFADHAVSISRRVYFLVTGEYATPRE
jgi:phosphate transport system protein